MGCKQITIDQCAAFSGLGPHEMFLGVTATARHNYIYAGYLLHHAGNRAALRDMMVADIRAAIDLGALIQAADVLIVLRRFLSEHLGLLVLVPSHDPGGFPKVHAKPALVHSSTSREEAV
jgi:hypothetical protein